MSPINNKTLILITLSAIIILAGFGFAKEASAAYYTSGYFISTNLLQGVSPAPTSIDSFVYNLSAKPSGTTATVGFNQDGGSTWYNAAGNVGTETLATSSNQTITLTSGWSGANFYYKVTFTSDGVGTPVLDDITVNYTVKVVPTVTTQAADPITAEGATFHGTITSTGGETVTRRGFVYKEGTSGDPTLADSVVQETGTFATGTYSLSVSDLSAGESYRVRAFAENNVGIGYGNTLSFTTVDPLPIPLSGPYEVTVRMRFKGTVNGVENGNLTIAEGKTLTINAGQTVVWNPGFSVIVNGSIAINKGAPGGQLRKTYLWLIDADKDGYPATTTQIAQNDQPSNGRRRKDFTNFTYVTDIALDTNESNDCIDVVTHLCCDDTNPTDGPEAKAAGEQGLPACQRCNGVSLDKVNITDNTGDSEGSNLCDATSGDCYRCSSGGCTYQTAAQDLFSECPGALGTCAATTCSGSGYSCGYLTGQQGCATCLYCTGSSYSCGNAPNTTDCGLCVKCNGSGACNNYYAVGTTDSTEPGTCTATHYRCNGAGSCTAPCSTSAVCGYYALSACTNSCNLAGYCGCKATCNTCSCQWGCSEPGYSCECYLWMY